MILRMLTLVLAFAFCLTSPIFASTERGDSLFQESGGAVGFPGIAGPLGAPGLAGAAGAAGIQGIPGIPGAPGLLDFADFYALQGTDNSAIGQGVAVNFPRVGSTTGAIIATGPSTFLLPTIGTYLVQFQVDVTAAAQLQLSLNTVPLPATVVGRATGPTQIIGISLVTTTTSNSVLEVINPNLVSLTIPASDGGTDAISAHLVIIRIQ
jgi:hypothetical protein